MRHLRLSGLILLCLLLPLSSALAEDKPAKATKKEQPDLLRYLEALGEQLAAHKQAPSRTRLNSGLYDAWSAILKPRAGAMAARLKNLQKERNWTGGKGKPLHVRPAAWSTFTRELASLYTQLGGALRGYENFRPKIKRPVSSFRGDDRKPPGSGDPIIGLDIAMLENQMVGNLRRGQPVTHTQLYSYYGMIEKYYAELERRREARRAWEEKQKRKKEKMDEIWSEVQMGIKFKKQSLQLQMISVRGLAGALQATEELRLQQLAAALPEGDTRGPALDALLKAMREKRQAAETFASSTTSKYGTLLRKWLASRKKASALLAKAP